VAQVNFLLGVSEGDHKQVVALLKGRTPDEYAFVVDGG
jgi:hypothetical protein